MNTMLMETTRPRSFPGPPGIEWAGSGGCSKKSERDWRVDRGIGLMLIEDWPSHPELKRLLDVWYVQRVEPLEQSGTVG